MNNKETTLSLPPHWSDDSLSEFLKCAFDNTLATFVHKTEAFELLKQVDDCFMIIGSNLNNPTNLVCGILLLRSHSAFRAGCRLAMSGQAADAFPSLRACLEFALYAIHIQRKSLSTVWLNRHENADSHKKSKSEFQMTKVMGSLQSKSIAQHKIIKELYERTIDFGAHPNERSVTSNMTIEGDEKRKELKQIYLHNDSLALDHIMKTTAQVGLGSLRMFELIFSERMALLGLQPKIDNLRSRL